MTYDSMPGIRWSALKHMRESPMMYHYQLTAPRVDTPAFALGRAVHTLVFEPALFESEYAIWDGGTRRGKEWADFQEFHEGKTILCEKDVDTCYEMADAVGMHPLVDQYLSGGIFERVIEWTDSATGLPCKAKPDWIIPDRKILLDLKTTRSINARRFGAEAARFGYHCQMAHYRNGIKAAQGWYAERVLLVAVEKEAPHDVAVFELGFEDMQAGEDEVAELLRAVRFCTDKGQWPGMYEQEQMLQLPAYIHGEVEFEYAE